MTRRPLLLLVLAGCNTGPGLCPFDAPLDRSSGTGGHLLALSAAAPHVMVAGGAGLARTTDGGRSWRAIGAGLPPAAPGALIPYSALAVAREGPARIYLALAGGDLFRSDDGGESWLAIGTGALQGLEVSSIQLPDGPGDQVWVVKRARGASFTSADRGASWTPGPLVHPAATAAGQRRLVADRALRAARQTPIHVDLGVELDLDLCAATRARRWTRCLQARS